MTTYDEQYLIDFGYRYPECDVWIPDGYVIMSYSFHCPFCRETLWYATIRGEFRLYILQDMQFFGQHGVLGEHTGKNCYEYRLSWAAVNEYNNYAREHGLPEVY